MMTLRRFRTLTESYGGDLRRWPEGLRPQARALLEKSGDARRMLARAQDLDDAIAAATAARSARIWSADRADAALERLRSGVAARTAATVVQREGWLAWLRELRPAALGAPRARWVGLTTAASLALVVGLALGMLYSPAAPAPDFFSSLLQPAPFQLLTNLLSS